MAARIPDEKKVGRPSRESELNAEKQKAKVAVNFRTTQETSDEIERLAQASGMNKSRWLIQACREKIERDRGTVAVPIGIARETVEEMISNRVREQFSEYEVKKSEENGETRETIISTCSAVKDINDRIFGNAKPMERLNNEFCNLNSEIERRKWAKENMDEIDFFNPEGNVPENLDIYGAYNGFVVFKRDNMILVGTFEDVFERRIYDDDDEEPFVPYNPFLTGIPVSVTDKVSPFLSKMNRLETREKRRKWAKKHLDPIDFELREDYRDEAYSPFIFYGMTGDFVVYENNGRLLYALRKNFKSVDAFEACEEEE